MRNFNFRVNSGAMSSERIAEIGDDPAYYPPYGGNPARIFMRQHKEEYESSPPEGVKRKDYEPAPATIPTTHLPQTLAKVRVMAERVARGEHLWHEDDAVVKQEDNDFEIYLSQLEELRRANGSDLPRQTL